MGGRQALSLKAFTLCIAFSVLSLADIAKFTVAVPSLVETTQAETYQVQLVVSGYVVAFALALLPAGRLGDRFSRRTLFLVGLALYTVASLTCALAPDLGVLIGARLTQGLAAGVQLPQIVGLIQQNFEGERRGRAYGYFGALIGVATAIGPVLGGVLLTLGEAMPLEPWRLLFWMNVPVGLIGVAVAAIAIPRAQKRPLLERQAPVPVRTVLRTLARLRLFRRGLAVAVIYNLAMPAASIVLLVQLQESGASPLAAGLVTVPFAAASAVASAALGRRIVVAGHRLVFTGLIVMGAGYLVVGAATALAEGVPQLLLVGGALLLAGAGAGAVSSPNMAVLMAEVPTAMAGVSGSVVQLGQRLATAAGTAAVLALYGVVRDSTWLAARSSTSSGVLAFATCFAGVVLILAVGAWVARPRRQLGFR